MVVDGEIPRECQSLVQTEEVNWLPLSDLRTGGTPNIENQARRKALTQDSAVMELNSATSGLHVVLSIRVRR